MRIIPSRSERRQQCPRGYDQAMAVADGAQGTARPTSRLTAFICVLSLVIPSLAIGAQPFRLISQHDPGQETPTGGSGDSWGPVLTPDGRYVVFASLANNLAAVNGADPIPANLHPQLNVYRHDRSNQTTVLVSMNRAGTGGGNDDSVPAGVSSNGQFVVFESAASDLVDGDTNGATDIFVRDLVNNTTTLVSASTNGEPGNRLSRSAAITPDGQRVAFVSAATNLVAEDTNAIPDIFVRDLPAATIVIASPGARATNTPALLGSESPEISADGRFVVFYSIATNLVPGVSSAPEIYLRDLLLESTTWVSAGSRTALGTTNAISFNHVMSADGRFVAYESCANPPGVVASARGVLLRFSRDTGLTDTVSTNAWVQNTAWQDVESLDITPDGRFIAYVAKTNTTGTTHIYLWDAQTKSNILVSASVSGSLPNGGLCEFPAMDNSGRFVAFISTAINLVTNDLGGSFHLYLRDVESGITTLLDEDPTGRGSPLTALIAPQISCDGRVVAFECPDSDLVADDRNHCLDVFLRDTFDDHVEMISRRSSLLPSLSANGPSAGSFTASSDGRFVAFASDADNLAGNDTNGCRDVFVRDLYSSTTELASVGTKGVAADGISSEPNVSPDGRYLAFTSAASNLTESDTNRTLDVFLRDLQTGVTTLVSVNSAGTGPGNYASSSPQVCRGGRYVLFQSLALNLTSTAFASSVNRLYLRDLQAGMTYALTTGPTVLSSMTPDGRLVVFADRSAVLAGQLLVWDSSLSVRVQTNSIPSPTNSITISPDRGTIACFANSAPGSLRVIDRHSQSNLVISPRYSAGTRSTIRFSADSRFMVYSAATATNLPAQVFLHDFLANTDRPISTTFGSTNAASQPSDSPVISADGRFVAYRSFATNLVSPSLSASFPGLYLYDQLEGTTIALSTDSSTGALLDNGPFQPAFTEDGRTLLFPSWASGIVGHDSNGGGDLFALSFLYLSIAHPRPGIGTALSWLARPGEEYRVQFKDHLSNSLWEDLDAPVAITGNQAQTTDSTPGTTRRFYRITTY